MIGYQNINSLRNKIAGLRVIVNNIPVDYFVIGEAKLNGRFPNAQFNLSGYEVRSKIDRDKYGGSLIEFVRQGFISIRLNVYETTNSQSNFF